jgi:preprotein translocase subunit SecA
MSVADPQLSEVPVEAPPTGRPAVVSGRLGSRLANYSRLILGWPWEQRLARAALMLPGVRWWEKKYGTLTDSEMLECGRQLRGRARGGENLDRMLPEAFGLVCAASMRILKLRPHDVQIAAGIVLHQGALAELATGEGKTLVACFPVYLNSLTGKGVHVATVNDYLARRDSEDLMGPLYKALGSSVACLQQQMGEQDRAKAYQCDITYGTASEFGFDFLRDRLKLAGNRAGETPFWDPWLKAAGGGGAKQIQLVQRPDKYFALVDEADNIFIDEARTPLIISTPTRPANAAEQVVYRWADRLGRTMKPHEHFVLDEKKQKIELTTAGRQLMRWSNPPTGPHSHAMDKLEEHVERALQVHHRMRLDQQYMIEKGKIVIIDESTGRRMPDRHWRDGLHQAVEAKENVQITMPSDHAAQITYQSFFRLYKKLAGMTGTAAQNWWEIRRVYKLWVVCVPTNRPIVRESWPDRVFPTEDAKFDAVVEEVKRLRDLGRAVLIGTRSVEKSELLSRKLKAAGVEHEVLNARFHDQEAKIIEHAGTRGKVTIATNMAGRGTDIKPPPEVLRAGGLHVLGTERHESLRVDRQLIGRAGRQGDPGSCQFYLSLEDELLEGLGEGWREYLTEIGAAGGSQNWQGYLGKFKKAQRRLEKRHYRSRVDLMVYEKRRQEILKDLGADPYVD